MERTVIHHRGAGDDSILLLTGGRLMQKFDISEMNGDQRSEAMSLSIQWMNQPKIRTAGQNITRRKNRILEDVNMSERVANYAAQMTEVARTRKERAKKAREEEKKRIEEEARERGRRFDELEQALGGTSRD